MRVMGLMVMGLMMLALGGCLERIAEFIVAPTSGAMDTLNDAGDVMTSSTLAPNNSQAINDIDRILQENPDTPNRDELQAMRGQLAGQQTAGAVPAGTTTKNKSLRRQMPIDRTLPRRSGDSFHRLTIYEADSLLPLRPVCAVIPPTAVVFGDLDIPYATNYAPVRMR